MISSDATPPEEAADAAFEEYLVRIDAGENVDIYAFLKEHPECAEELRLSIEAEQCAKIVGEAALPEQGRADELGREMDRLLDSTRLIPGLENDDSNLDCESIRPCLETPLELGDYRLLQPVARGGMGMVFKAQQVSLGRIVAVKVMLERWLATDSAVQRFRSEAQLAARLQHPHIVQIYEIGEEDGRYFFSMEFVAGRNLLEIIQENPLSPKRAAEIMACVSEAMEYAHGEDLLHRDLKPSNILIDDRNRPRITDFGLACAVGETTDLTGSGEILGTASYMSPEQAMARPAHELSPASDVYSLGAVLYALLVGRPPFQSDSSLDTLLQVREQDPLPLRKLNSKIPRDLDTISLKCLAKSPSKRYSTAQELADDLNRYLEGKPIKARPASFASIVWRWCRRHRASALGLVMSLVFAVVLVAGVFVYGVHTNRLNSELKNSNDKLTVAQGDLLDSEDELKTALMRVTESRDDALNAQEKLRELLYAADLRAAGRAYAERDFREVIRLLNRQIPSEGATDFRGPEWHLLHRLAAPPHQALAGHVGDVYAVSFSPDGRWLASAGEDTSLRIYRADSLEPHAKIFTGLAAVRGVAFDPFGKSIAAACFDGKVHIYDIASLQKRITISAHPGEAWDVAWTPDGRSLATCGNDDWVRFWDPRTGRPQTKIGPQRKTGKPVRRLAISSDKRFLATACDSDYTLWDITSGTGLVSQTVLTRVTSVAFSPDSQKCLFSTLTGEIHEAICEPKPTIAPVRSEHGDSVEAVAISSDGSYRASVDRGGVLSLFHLEGNSIETSDQRSRLHQNFAHEGRVLTVDFSPDNARVVTAGQDGVLRIWKIEDLDRPRTLALPGKHQSDSADVNAFRFCFDGGVGVINHTLASQWDPESDEVIELMAGQDFSSIATTADASHCFVGTSDGTISHYDFAAQSISRQVRFPDLGMIGDLALSLDETGLIALNDLELLVLDPSTLRKREGIEKIRCNAMAVSPDGKTLAVSRKVLDNIELWDIETFTRLKSFPGHGAVVKSLKFSRDGRWIASGSEDRLIKIWRVSDGDLIWTLCGHRGRVFGVDFSADGKRVFSAGTDGTLRVWSLSLGQELLTLFGNEKLPFRREHQIAVSPDGRSLVHNRMGVLSHYDLTEDEATH